MTTTHSSIYVVVYCMRMIVGPPFRLVLFVVLVGTVYIGERMMPEDIFKILAFFDLLKIPR